MEPANGAILSRESYKEYCMTPRSCLVLFRSSRAEFTAQIYIIDNNDVCILFQKRFPKSSTAFSTCAAVFRKNPNFDMQNLSIIL